MEHVDRQLEKRVWDRVCAREQGNNMPPLQRENLKPWILVAQENTAVLRGLQLQLIGKQWEGLRRLEGECSRMVLSLRGICAMQGERVKLNPVPTPREVPRRALEKCYHRTRRIWEEMQRRTADPEHGPVFRKLARQAEDHCSAMAELIGRLE